MVSKDDAAVALSHAAASYHEGGYPSTVGPEFEALASAAIAYARASGGQGPTRVQASGSASGVTVPFGKTKGQPIESETEKGLRYLIDYATRAVDDLDKAKWREGNQKLLTACLNELGRRGAK